MNTTSMTMILRAILMIFAMGFVAAPAWAACEIEDIVDMVDDGLERREIRKDCGGEVLDAGSCSFSKVYRLADDGMDADEIRDECEGGGAADPGRGADPGPGAQSQLWCCNPYNGMKVCPMVVQMPLGSMCQCGGVPGAGLVCQ